MADPANPHGPTSDLEHAAAGWVLRSDRGLTAAEQDELSEWLAADPRHGPALARHRQLWRKLDRLTEWRPEHGAGPNPDLLAPPVRRRSRVLPFVTAAVLAAAAAMVVFLRTDNESLPVEREAPAMVAAAGESVVRRTLPDGSTAELNRGTVIAVEYTPGERRVRLTSGEAHFTVTRDVERPFVVVAGDVRVRAVGTAFNVRLGESAVEVLVTEGKVEVSEPESRGDPTARAIVPILEARQRVVLSAASLSTVPQVATLTAGEVERVLAWQHRLLDFTATPLAEVVAEFNRRNSVRLVLADPTLGAVPVSASFRSDNIEGFVALLEAGFGVRAERRGDTEILLRR